MQNFGKIKNIFNSLLAEGISTKNEKKKGLFKEYVKAIKSDKILSAQFLVYNNIERKVETNEHKATEFVKSNIELLNKFSKKQIVEANSKLLKLIEGEIPQLTYDSAQLHEDIETLIFTKKNPKTIDTIVESTNAIVNHILNKPLIESKNTQVFPNSILADIAIGKFNDKYSDLSEDEKRILKVIIESDENGKKELFTIVARECVDLVDRHINESGSDTKEKLLQTKDKLLRLEYNDNSFITDISKLIELKKDLIE